MKLLAALTLILAPIAVVAVYLTVSVVFLIELRRAEPARPGPPTTGERATVRPRPLHPARRQPFTAARPCRSRKSSARSATSSHPSSTASECPRSGSTEYSVTPVLRR